MRGGVTSIYGTVFERGAPPPREHEISPLPFYEVLSEDERTHVPLPFREAMTLGSLTWALVKEVFTLQGLAVLMLIALVVWCFLKTPSGTYRATSWDDLGGILEDGFPDAGERPPRRRVNKSEERCRSVFETIYKASFPTVRPPFLRNPATGRNLELDGYNPEVLTPLGRGLAFEYDGVQHAQYSPYFHRAGPQAFLYQDTKDRYKDRVCASRGILLLRIPHFIAFHDLERYIRKELRDARALPSQTANLAVAQAALR